MLSLVEILADNKVSIMLSWAKAKLLLLKLIHLFAREVLLLKKLEIEETVVNCLVWHMAGYLTVFCK